jgi:hypothetical protein
LRARVVATGTRVWAVLARWNVPFWAIGIVVALITWRLSFGLPAIGIDGSWIGGLYMAAHDGRDFGTQIVFTYGPLGFLAFPDLWYSDLAALAFVYGAAIYFAFSCTLIWVLSRSLGKLGAAIVAFVFLAILPDLEQLPLVLAAAWALMAMQEERPRFAINLLIFGGASLAALESLVKLSVGPPIFLICVIALAGARASRRQWSTFLGVGVIELVALWLLTGQPLGNLSDYFLNGEQIVSGYNEAMVLKAGPGWEAPAILLVAVGITAGTAFAGFRDARARWCAVGLVGFTAFITFKYGIVRYEPDHLAIAFSTALALWLVIPWGRGHRPLAIFLAGTALIGAVALYAYPAEPRFDPVENLTSLSDQAEILFSPGLRNGLSDSARVALQSQFHLDPRTLAQLQGKGVEIDPWEIGVAWAYRLNWSPLPVFQNYSAYTAKLDRLNAEAVEAPDGPERILRENPLGIEPSGGSRGFESRHPAWDPPEQNFAVVCNFAPLRTTESWQVLTRIPDRCGHEEFLSEAKGGPGTVISVPPAGPGELILMRIHGLGVSGFERLRALLWRPGLRFAHLNGDTVTYRLVPGTAADGLMVSPSPGLDSAGAFAQIPSVQDISMEGVSRELTYDFYRVPVRVRPRAARGRPVPGQRRRSRTRPG